VIDEKDDVTAIATMQGGGADIAPNANARLLCFRRLDFEHLLGNIQSIDGDERIEKLPCAHRAQDQTPPILQSDPLCRIGQGITCDQAGDMACLGRIAAQELETCRRVVKKVFNLNSRARGAPLGLPKGNLSPLQAYEGPHLFLGGAR
jgi:hypothetical protein